MAATRPSIEDEGFTLIELMVVVLIIAVLLAIAIPTFLGARERANNRAVQSNLRNAHTNELVFYTDHQVFTADVDTLRNMDPSLAWTVTDTDMALSPRSMYVVLRTTNRTDDTVIVGGKSKSGDCFWIRAVGDEDLPRFAVNDCSSVPLAFDPQWT
jgi:type IV pilus assembly protein PilA